MNLFGTFLLLLFSFRVPEPEPLNVRDFGAVGDGVTNDRVAIQNTVDAAYAQDADVYLPAGTYLIDDDALYGKSGVDWIGESAEQAVLILAPDSAHHLLALENISTVRVEDVGFNGNRSAGQPNERYSIYLKNSAWINVLRCSFTNGVHLRADELNHDILVDNCTFDGGKYGIATQGTDLKPVSNLIIRNCDFRNFAHEAIDINNGTTDCLIISNTMFNCGITPDGGETRNEVIDVGGTNICARIEIAYNQIDCNNEASGGIHLKQGTTDAVIHHNEILNCGWDAPLTEGAGIYLSRSDNIQIYSNVVDVARRGFGYTPVPGINTCDIHVFNNTFTNIDLNGAVINAGLRFEKNQVFGDADRADEYGVLIGGGSNTVVTGNTIARFTNFGIYDSSGATVDLVISSNHVSQAKRGMRTLSSGVLIEGNTCTNNDEQGISVTGTDVQILNNVCTDNVNNGIVAGGAVYACDGLIIQSNRCERTASGSQSIGIRLTSKMRNVDIRYNELINHSVEAIDGLSQVESGVTSPNTVE